MLASFRLGTRLTDVDAAFEERAIFDRDSCRDNIAGERAFAANVDAVAGLAIAAHFAQHYNLARHDVRCDLSIASYGHAIARQVDCAFHFAVDVERFRSAQLTL